MLMMVAMVMAMAKIFAFRFYISKLPINRLRGRYVKILSSPAFPPPRLLCSTLL